MKSPRSTVPKALPTFALETLAADACGGKPVCGVDEAGRGPWAGPVSAAAVILDPARLPPGINDSKALSAAARERLEAGIKTHAVAWAVGFA